LTSLGRLEGYELCDGLSPATLVAGTATVEAMPAAFTISFVIPAFNEEALLPKTLRSIVEEIARTGCPAEIIVVNNASTDTTPVVARSFDGVKVVDEPVKGLVRARRAGFLAASGRLIANIDADTALPSGWLRQVLEEFGADPRLVALSGPYVYDDISPFANWCVRGFYRVGYAVLVINRLLFGVGAMLQGGNFIVTREALARIGGYNDTFVFYGEDTDVACRLAVVGQVKFSFRLAAFSSGRRLAKEGLVRMAFRYGVNFVWTTFFRRPFTKSAKDIR
jgi:glycosyltransferase involved in cell wall biosynthesis